MGNQSSTLHEAAAHNDLAKVEAAIRYQNADVNSRDGDGWTPLHFAAYGGALEVTQSLLLRGANPDPADKAGRTPLHLAALQGHTHLASLLIGRGATVDAHDENDMTPLHKSAIKGTTEVGEQLLRLGAKVNGEVKDGTRAIHLAAWKGHLDFVKLLLSRGADFRAVTHNGRTPLHEAAESGHSDIVQLLLTYGADAHAQDKDGQIPASLAAHAGQRDVSELIARRGEGAASQAGRSGPSAPPLPADSLPSGPVHYPNIYQSKSPPTEGAVEAQHNKDFWNESLGEQGKEQATNQGFWGAALGGGSAPQTQQPVHDSPRAEAARNKAFWDKKLAGGLASIPKTQSPEEWSARVSKAADAWDAQIRSDESAAGMVRGTNRGRTRQQQEEEHPRKQFEQNLLKQAQGLWGMLQGKGGEQEKEARERREAEKKRQEAQAIDNEWGGGSSGKEQGWAGEGAKPKVPTQELYNLKPFEDDDDYEEDAPSEPRQRNAQDLALAHRRLAELELNLDREQGWIRGGSKSEAEAAKARQKRIQEQEAEIAALKRQLAGSHQSFGGRTGGRNLDDGAPAEFLCPITQEIMHDPVIAGDGYSYERAPIEQWMNSGHNTSPMTGGHMPKQALTPNNALRSAIRQWQGR